MDCKLCGSTDVSIVYNDVVRNGGIGKYTENEVAVWKCNECEIIWHEPLVNINSYYESKEYRESLENTSEEEAFYKLHDQESMEKLQYVGTEKFRGKIVADIGCGCGAFLDYVNSVATDVVAIEPSEAYRKIMNRKGFHVYPYASDAIADYEGKLNLITSFDVIEHVNDPLDFLKEIYQLLDIGGSAFIGTPTNAPIMRSLMGQEYEKKLLYSVQHLWIFSEKNLSMISGKIGFKKCSFKYYQRYGLSNLLAWLKERKPMGHIQYDFVTAGMDAVYKAEVERMGLSDYIVMYLSKDDLK